MSMRPRPQTQQIGHRPTTEVVGKAGHHDETKTNWGNTEDEPVAWNIKHFFPIKNVLLIIPTDKRLYSQNTEWGASPRQHRNDGHRRGEGGGIAGTIRTLEEQSLSLLRPPHVGWSGPIEQ